MTSIEPMHSGMPSRTVTLPEYFPLARLTNWRQVVGRSLTRSLRYMNPVVPQSFATDQRSLASNGSLRNFASMFFFTFGSFDQSIGSSSFASARICTM